VNNDVVDLHCPISVTGNCTGYSSMACSSSERFELSSRCSLQLCIYSRTAFVQFCNLVIYIARCLDVSMKSQFMHPSEFCRSPWRKSLLVLVSPHRAVMSMCTCIRWLWFTEPTKLERLLSGFGAIVVSRSSECSFKWFCVMIQGNPSSIPACNHSDEYFFRVVKGTECRLIRYQFYHIDTVFFRWSN